jgi:mycobactin salicyl-AMP ligase
MLWRAMEIAKVYDLLEPKALIGASHFADGKPAEMLRDVAATRRSVRIVLGYGLSLPEGVLSLDNVIGAGRPSSEEFPARTPAGPSLITFTARANAPLVPLLRHEKEVLAQGAMAVLALSLLRSDTILNAYPPTGPIGLALGFAPWLIGGGTLVQHDPFDSGTFVEQLYDSGATVTALPGAFLDQLTEDGLLDDPQCKLRRVGLVWSAAALADRGASLEAIETDDVNPSAFDVYPLGDLACLIVRAENAEARPLLPLGTVHLGEDGGGAVFAETSLAENDTGEILLRGPVEPEGRTGGPVLRDEDGFAATGLHGQANGHGGMKLFRDPELVHHGGFTVAAAELDGLYQAFPGFLDAACFVLPDPIIGDRIFAAVAPLPNAPVSLEVLRSSNTCR